MSIKHGIKTLAVVGASGQMGNGIAYVAATKAQIPRILICDQSDAQLDKGLAFFDKLLAKDVSKGKLTQDDADRARASLTKAPGGAASLAEIHQDGPPDMVIEAATENLNIKQSIFKTLASTLPLSTILATNTSSISVSKIAASAVPENAKAGSPEAWQSPARTLGLHFFNPVPVMKLVELIPALQTSKDVTDRARAFAEACGKTITVSADTPGFVSNRLLIPFINEAVMALESGVATKEDIDTTLKLGMNHPMGPLQLADFIGLDTCYYIGEVLLRETGDSKYRPSVLLGRMVDAGWLGKKSGKGFYDYN
ncbi:putative 3-hydroxybutyryl-CoA dehydrogenase [Meira miltonrushii]|uniref:Putative 3-hydroxybutyryl-CoA dehydrogenase n=1 Tax=Meira miltonrushii TaxID=1280837 RepID=A0A316V9P2_9BASI|nr:putative 3-hydroxybutyryl-CoA dehydrogenase [Meira miltonrushii]PWN33768.1 putative 3-hydroxybutyryl-CoA dehydrogenase [Meira miltonrushii]